jgi:hypothetical protein
MRKLTEKGKPRDDALRSLWTMSFVEMFTLDVRHYCSTVLHPKYRSLKGCSENERSQCHRYVREQLKIIRSSASDSSRESLAHELKRFKKNEDLFSRFEEDHPLNNSFIQQDDCGSDSDEYDFDTKQSDELDLYLVMDIDRSSLSNDPLAFWRSHTYTLPVLSEYAK